MLFCAQYWVEPDDVEVAMAKRLEFEEVRPDTLKVVCEYALHGKPPPYGGFMVVETDDPAALNFLVIYFGKTVTFDVRACSDVVSTVAMTQEALRARDAGAPAGETD
jgi:hypothetical protein